MGITIIASCGQEKPAAVILPGMAIANKKISSHFGDGRVCKIPDRASEMP